MLQKKWQSLACSLHIHCSVTAMATIPAAITLTHLATPEERSHVVMDSGLV